MLIVYPGFNAIFLTLSHTHQVAFVLVLPMIKASYKISTDLEDLAPAIVASVDLFDALYTTRCMQSIGSLWVGFTIIALDVAQDCVALSSLFKQFRVLRGNASGPKHVSTTQLLSLILTLVTSQQVLARADSIFIHSRNRLKLSAEAHAKIDAPASVNLEQGASSRGHMQIARCCCCPGQALEPCSCATGKSLASQELLKGVSPAGGRPPDQQNPTRLIRDTARLLHRSSLARRVHSDRGQSSM